MQDILRFHVPCKLEYTSLVENVTELVGNYLDNQNQELAKNLKTVMNEVFMNIVNHSNTASKNEIVRFQFELGYQYFTTSIYDYGPGFKADQHYPPYPKNLAEKKFKLRELMDGTVYFTVIDPFSISFQFEEREKIDVDQFSEIAEVRDNGLGISIITKLMDSVTYSYIGQGKYDWKIIKKIK
jgi:anti-sigma regulatory factor (Ser/Thr protein kinase)